MRASAVIGRQFPNPTFKAKVAGKYPFLTDLNFQGSLYGAVIRSPYPHARVIAIDQEQLLRRPGVVGCFTPADIPDVVFNPATLPPSAQLSRSADKRLLTTHPQHVGDGVALVLADTLDSARRAVLDAPVAWEALPAFLTAEDAYSNGNLMVGVTIGATDIEPALKTAHLLVDREIRLERAQHVCLEPHACAAVPGTGSGMTLWTNTQCPAELRRLVCEVTGIPVGQLHVIKQDEGGGFGNKQEMYEEALIVWAAKALRQPVSLAFTRAEEFTSTRVRHGGNLRLRAAFDADGSLSSTWMEAVLDGGAYASHTPYVLSCLGGHLPSVYPRAQHRFTGCAVRTHTTPSGAYRGYGVAQAATLAEQVMDEAARRLRLSPTEIRMRNISGTIGARLRSCLARLSSSGCAVVPQETSRQGTRRGVGLAVAAKSSVTEAASDLASAWVRIADDTSVLLGTGTCDSGTGSSLALAQIVASVLGLADPGAVRVIEGDSAKAPIDVGSTAQRSIFVGGFAAHKAATACRQALLTAAAGRAGRAVEEVCLRWPRVFDSHQDRELCAVDELLPELRQRQWTVTAQPPPTRHGTSVCAIRAVVTVDRATGRVDVDQVTAVVDCGVVVSPMGARGQVAGAVAQGIGLALTDSFDSASASSILSHGAPRTLDVPAMHIIFIRPTGTSVPTGLGELAIVATPAAIANAVADAVGNMCARFPLRPEAVVAADHGRDQ